MTTGRNIIAASLCLLMLLAGVSAAEIIDDSPEVISLYEKGKRLLREKDWFGAVDVFKELEARFPGSPNSDLFVFNRGKAKYHLADYSEAVAAFNYFISRFPNSAYLAHAYFFLGSSHYLKGDVNRAVQTHLKAFELSNDRELDELLTASLLGAFRNAASVNLTDADFRRLSEDKACALARPLSRIHLERGEMSRAASMLAVCGEHLDVSGVAVPDAVGASDLEIAVVLPLSGELQSYGEEIYNGAVIAVDLFRRETGRDVSVLPYDTRGDPIEAARIIGDLSRSSSTDAVIGPLTSEEAAVSSAALNCASLPLIAPAATQAGLTRLSSTTFQLAPNIDLEGIAMAQYAVRELGADSVAIISSTAADHLRMTRAFAGHFESLGGTVVAYEYYRSRDKDFGAYIRDIKAILLGQPADSTYFINADGDTLDADIVPAFIDCIFLPGDAGQLRQLLPQIHFYNLNGAYLGSDGWGDPEVYKLGDNITKGAVFSSPFLEGRQSEQYLKLATTYDKRYASRPQRLAALGFDAASLIAAASVGAGATRDDILNRLQPVSGYEGASGRISFGEYRENIEMPIYRIEGERAIELSSGQNTETSKP